MGSVHSCARLYFDTSSDFHHHLQRYRETDLDWDFLWLHELSSLYSGSIAGMMKMFFNVWFFTIYGIFF